MLVSQWVVFIGQMVHMSFSGQVVIAIMALIAGSMTFRGVRALESSVWLTVIGLVLALLTLSTIQASNILHALIFTTCVGVVGHEMYRRLVWR